LPYHGSCCTQMTEDDLIKRLNEWTDNVENRNMRVNMNKTKGMISGEWQKVTQKAVRWPYGRGTGNNSIQCTSCQKLVLRKCSGIKGSMYSYKVMKTFVCRGCVNPVTSIGLKCRYWCQRKSGVSE